MASVDNLGRVRFWGDALGGSRHRVTGMCQAESGGAAGMPNSYRVWVSAGILSVAVIGIGCQRAYYYKQADQDAAALIEEKSVDPRWGIDDFSDFKYLWSTNLTNVDFTGSNLSYSDFSYSDITGANLKDADLTGAIWYYTICPDGTNSGKTGSCSAI